MSTIIFSLAFIFFFIWGYKTTAKPSYRNFLLLTWVLALFPFSSIFVSFYYKGGLLATDGIFFGLITFLILQKKKSFTAKGSSYILFLSLALLLSLNFAFKSADVVFSFSSLLKDLKAIIYIPLLFLFFRYVSVNFHNHSLENINAIRTLGIVSFISAVKCLILLHFNSSGAFSGTVSGGDDFYSSDQEMMERYSDFSLPLGFSFLLTICFFNKKSLRLDRHLLTILVSYVAITYSSGNRTFLLSGIILIWYILTKSNRIVGASFASIISFSIVSVAAYFEELLYRFYSLASLELVLSALQTRYSPFFDWIKSNPSPYSLFFGNGLGASFYITWFEYRENIDPHSPFVDNLYLTFSYKYGFLILFFLFVYLFFKLFHRRENLAEKFFASLAIFLIGLTMSIVYQSYFSVILVWLILAKNVFHSSLSTHD